MKTATEWDDWTSDDASDVLPSKGYRWADVPVIQLASSLDDCSASSDAKHCSNWLKEMGSLLNPYDTKVLRRYVPSLPLASFRKLTVAVASERVPYLVAKGHSFQHGGAEAQISKMAMRRILETSFMRLAPVDSDIQELHRHWQATKDKSKRKGKLSAQQHTEKWRQNG